MSRVLQLQHDRTLIDFSEDQFRSAQEHFSTYSYLKLPNFVEPSLLERLLGLLDQTAFYERVHPGIGTEICAAPGPATGALELMMNDGAATGVRFRTHGVRSNRVLRRTNLSPQPGRRTLRLVAQRRRPGSTPGGEHQPEPDAVRGRTAPDPARRLGRDPRRGRQPDAGGCGDVPGAPFDASSRRVRNGPAPENGLGRLVQVRASVRRPAAGTTFRIEN